MTITTSALNNIESAITNPSVNGIFIVNYNPSTYFLSHSFAQIKAQFQAGNLVLIKVEIPDNGILSYHIITQLSKLADNLYYVDAQNFTFFQANSETDLLQEMRDY